MVQGQPAGLHERALAALQVRLTTFLPVTGLRSAVAALAVAGALLPAAASAHPGGVAADGCHNHRASNTCHCHREGASRPGCTGGDTQRRRGGDRAPATPPKPSAEVRTGTLPAPPEWIRLASWNLNLLHWRTGGALWRGRGRPERRRLSDPCPLRARDLDADVIAFQEVNGPRAASRVFPARDYDLHFSGRHDSRYDDIYVGFAVRKGRFDRVAKRDVPALGNRSGLALRAALGCRPCRPGRRTEPPSAQRPPQVGLLRQGPRESREPPLPEARPADRAARVVDRCPRARRRAVRGPR